MTEGKNAAKPLPVLNAERRAWARHHGRGRRLLARLADIPMTLVDRVDEAGRFIQKFANTIRFERLWREKIFGDPNTAIVPRFEKGVGKGPIWNIAINWIRDAGPSGTVLEFGTNNGGWLYYFSGRLPTSIRFVGFDCFEGLPESWDGLPAGSIKGYGFPLELWSDDPIKKQQVLAAFATSGLFPEPPQHNIRIEAGLFAQSLPRYLQSGWPSDLRLIHFDADLYMSTRPVLDTLCGPLTYRYLILFDEFCSANHEFRAWCEFTDLFKISDWRIVAAAEDGAQVLIEVNCRNAIASPATRV
jgi:Macrocin-O-methyltransferase (TylF)